MASRSKPIIIPGEPLIDSNASMPADTFLRLIAKVRIDANGCWIFHGCRKVHGYRSLTIHGYPQLAHRVSWAAFYGPIPAGLNALHRCDVGSCINPDDLFLGTQAENMADMRAKGRAGTPRAPFALRDEDAWIYLDRLRGGTSKKALAAEIGIDRGTLAKAVKRWGSGAV